MSPRTDLKTVKTSVLLPEVTHSALKAWAAIGNCDLTTLIVEALDKYLERLPEDPRMRGKGLTVLKVS